MEILQTVAEAVFISFFVGAIMGGAVVAHFQLKPQSQEDESGLQPKTVEINDRNDG